MTDTTNNCPQCEQMAKRIEELEAACAVRDEALSGLIAICECDSDEPEEVGIARTALASTPPTGMVFVGKVGEWMVCEWHDGALFTSCGYEDITDDSPTLWLPLRWPSGMVAIREDAVDRIISAWESVSRWIHELRSAWEAIFPGDPLPPCNGFSDLTMDVEQLAALIGGKDE